MNTTNTAPAPSTVNGSTYSDVRDITTRSQRAAGYTVTRFVRHLGIGMTTGSWVQHTESVWVIAAGETIVAEVGTTAAFKNALLAIAGKVCLWGAMDAEGLPVDCAMGDEDGETCISLLAAGLRRCSK